MEIWYHETKAVLNLNNLRPHTLNAMKDGIVKMKIISRTLFLMVLEAVCAITAFPMEKETGPFIVGYGKVEGYIESRDEGVGTALLREVLKRVELHGYTFETRFQPFERIIKNFIHGEFQICFPIINSGGFRRSGFEKWGFKLQPLYSAPLYTAGGFIIFTRKDQPRHDTLMPLKGRQIGVIRGAYMPNELKGKGPYFVHETNNGEQNFKKLHFGRIDAFVVQKAWGLAILRRMELTDFHHGAEFNTIQGGFIFQQGQTGASLLAEFNQAIGTMILDGTYAAILASYPGNTMVFRYPR